MSKWEMEVAGREHLTLESRQVFKGKIFEVYVDRVRLPSGEVVEREVVRHPGAVGVVVVENGRILLVRQMRHAPGAILLEIPAGKLDVHGEAPAICAMRELEEETGYRCQKVNLVTSFFNSPGFADELFHLYFAFGAEKVAEPPSHDSGEPISIEWLGLDEAIDQINERRIRDAKTIIGVLMAKLRSEEVEQGSRE